MKSFLSVVISLLLITQSFAQSGFSNGAGYDNGIKTSGGSGGVSTITVANGTTNIQPNVGIGSANAQNYLDIEGGGILVGPTWNIGIGTLSPLQALSVNGNASFNGGISTIAWTDPINDWNAAGIITTTTTSGTNNSGQNILNVASATGWAVGMGIAVQNAGTGGNTELISYVTAINGTAFTLHDNLVTTITTGQTVNHDDTRALIFSVNSGRNVHIRAGTYNVTSEIDVIAGIYVQGDGPRGRNVASGETLTNMGTVIQNRGLTNIVFKITSSDVGFFDLSVEEAVGTTPTAGYAFQWGSATKLLNERMNNIVVYGTYDGINVAGLLAESYFSNLFLETQGGSSNTGACFTYSNASPGGDQFAMNITCIAINAGGKGFWIRQSDTTGWDTLKGLNFDNDLRVDDSVSVAQNIRIVNSSFENGTSNNTNVIITSSGSGVNGVTLIGSEFGVNTNSSGSGLTVSGAASNIIIDDNVFQSLSQGATLSTSGKMTFTNNTFRAITNSNVNYTGVGALVFNGNIYDGSGTYTANTGSAIGSLIYSDASFTTGQANVGIGTGQPPTNLFNTGTSALIGNVGINSVNPGQALDVQGTLRLAKLGGTLAVASGTNGCQGQATLSGGTVTVSTTCTPTTSQGIFLQDATTGALTNVGTQTVGTVTSGTSFVINSTNVLDASTVNWFVIKSS